MYKENIIFMYIVTNSIRIKFKYSIHLFLRGIMMKIITWRLYNDRKYGSDIVIFRSREI